MPQAADEVSSLKEELRRRLRAERAALSPADIVAASTAVCWKLSAMDVLARARRVAAYAATRGEIDPSAWATELAARAVTVAYPRIAAGALRFHASGPAGLLPDAFDIPAPRAGAPEVLLQDLEVVVVPGIAFDRRGHRLGYGAGYYDRALAGAVGALRIGLCHDFQLVESVPHSAADQPVDFIVAPSFTHASGARQGIPMPGGRGPA